MLYWVPDRPFPHKCIQVAGAEIGVCFADLGHIVLRLFVSPREISGLGKVAAIWVIEIEL